MDLRAAVEDLNQMILNGQALDAFEKYYAENCTMQDGNTEPRVGKDANRDFEVDFFNSLTEFRNAEVHNVAVGDNVTMVEWTFDYTHKDWGDVHYRQIAVQEWENGQIVAERFYQVHLNQTAGA